MPADPYRPAANESQAESARRSTRPPTTATAPSTRLSPPPSEPLPTPRRRPNERCATAVDRLRDSTRDYSDSASQHLDEAQRYVRDRVRERPMTAAAAGLGSWCSARTAALQPLQVGALGMLQRLLLAAGRRRGLRHLRRRSRRSPSPSRFTLLSSHMSAGRGPPRSLSRRPPLLMAALALTLRMMARRSAKRSAADPGKCGRAGHALHARTAGDGHRRGARRRVHGRAQSPLSWLDPAILLRASRPP